MEKQQVLAILGEILNDNIGQRLTVVMANGIMTTFAAGLPKTDLDNDGQASDPLTPPNSV